MEENQPERWEESRGLTTLGPEGESSKSVDAAALSCKVRMEAGHVVGLCGIPFPSPTGEAMLGKVGGEEASCAPKQREGETWKGVWVQGVSGGPKT